MEFPVIPQICSKSAPFDQVLQQYWLLRISVANIVLSAHLVVRSFTIASFTQDIQENDSNKQYYSCQTEISHIFLNVITHICIC